MGANSSHNPLAYVREALEDAEHLMKYAAEIGREVDKQTRDSVIEARVKIDSGIDEVTTENLLDALTKLAQVVGPVTPESLRACAINRERPPYRTLAIVLAIFIIAFSTVSFVTSAIATSIRNDITTANQLAVTLNAQFASPTSVAALNTGQRSPANSSAQTPSSPVPTTTAEPPRVASFNASPREGCPPPSDVSNVYFEESAQNTAAGSESTGTHPDDVEKNFQEYAAAIRRIDAHSRELSLYVHIYKYLFDPASIDAFHRIRNCPIDLNRVFELQLPLANYKDEVVRRTRIYQLVRFYAQSTSDDVTFYYNAVSSCILPVLYALLGAVAYILKNFEQRIHERTYVPSRADSARFIIAAIGGMVVGLFSNFPTVEGVKVSPLALAFLVGYAVDVFYTFLENLIQSFTKTAMNVSRSPDDKGGLRKAETDRSKIDSNQKKAVVVEDNTGGS